MIEVHTVATMNGMKVALMLEETGLAYTAKRYNPLAGDHLTPEFHNLNPNHKLPVIVDRDPADGGPPLTVFETGAILMYLAEKTGRFMPTDFRRREVARQWLIWQVAGLGPMHGQANHFLRYAPAGNDYAVARYSKEAVRLMNVLESRLKEHEYLADEYSIADIACWSFASVCHAIGIDIGDFPATADWSARIAARPAVARVLANRRAVTPQSALKARMNLNEAEWNNVFGDRMLNAAKGVE